MKVKASEYFNALLKKEGKTVGRLDSRYLGINENLKNQYAITDPQSDAISPAYTIGFLDYLHGDLGVSKELNYKTSARVASMILNGIGATVEIKGGVLKLLLILLSIWQVL